MPVLMIRYQLADEGVPEVVDAVSKAFAAIADERPDGIRYAYLRRPDSTEFVALLMLDDGTENPLPAIDAARELRATVAKWTVGNSPTP